MLARSSAGAALMFERRQVDYRGEVFIEGAALFEALELPESQTHQHGCRKQDEQGGEEPFGGK
jgi:hypothetical protein